MNAANIAEPRLAGRLHCRRRYACSGAHGAPAPAGAAGRQGAAQRNPPQSDAPELELVELRGRIQSQVQGQLSQNQREFYLREQLKAIQKELGERAMTPTRDIEEPARKLEAAGMAGGGQDRSLARTRTGWRACRPHRPNTAWRRTYLEWMASLPWSNSSGSHVDVKRAAEILDEDHYDLEKVKERILDYLAVLQLKPVLKGPILCFVGPPGVGKTSLGRSIARSSAANSRASPWAACTTRPRSAGIAALTSARCRGRSFRACAAPVPTTRSSCSMKSISWARISAAIRASALLEVLDPEQNSTYRDNYLDVPFDLSKVLFITTANVLDPVPDALRDRMEIIPLEGYTEQEKVIIAFRYLVPAADYRERSHRRAGHRIRRRRGALPGAPLHARSWRAQPGARDRRHLPQAGAAHRRRHAREGAGHARNWWRSTWARRAIRTDTEVADRTRAPRCGRRSRLDAGGRRRPVHRSAGACPGGNKGLIMTGQLGPVMQESVQAALTWVRGSATKYGIDPDLFKTSDIHIHVPAGAIPKDGPSAGITMATRAALHAHGPQGAQQSRHDRRDHAHRASAPDRRHQGKGAGRKTQRRSRSHHSATKTKSTSAKT